jgi:hypothetical protein
MSARPSNAYGVNRGIRSSSAGVSRADCGGISQPTRRRYKSTAIRSSISAVTFGRAMARTSHLPSSGLVVISYLSSTWGRADQQTSHDSIESGAFCFARKTPSCGIRNYIGGAFAPLGLGRAGRGVIMLVGHFAVNVRPEFLDHKRDRVEAQLGSPDAGCVGQRSIRTNE